MKCFEHIFEPSPNELAGVGGGHSRTMHYEFTHCTWPVLRYVCTIELLDIECVLCHVTGVQFDRKSCPYKSAILDFLQKLPFPFAQNVLGQAKFALINPPFCCDNFLTDTRYEPPSSGIGILALVNSLQQKQILNYLN